MKNLKIVVFVLLVICLIGATIYIVLQNNNSNNNNLNQNNEQEQGQEQDTEEAFAKGVWWWSVTEPDEVYLGLASQNEINEIYYSNSKFDDSVNEFIGKANKLGISVYYLCGEYQWIDDYSGFEKVIENYKIYQTNFENKFNGIHVDVEAHQHPDWDNEELQNDLIVRYLNFAYHFTSNENYSDISFDFDIPFWYENYEVEFNGELKQAYKHIIDIADRTFVMSYRDSASRIYDVAKNELEYASSINKKVFLCVETSRQSETPEITFFEEGKEYMYTQLENLKNIIIDEYGEDFSNFGFSIHHMRSYYELPD